MPSHFHHKSVLENGVPTGEQIQVPFTAQEETEWTAANDARIATQPMRDWQQNRISAYGSVGDQLDMQYWDGVNGTTVWPDHIATVKSANPKPGR